MACSIYSGGAEKDADAFMEGAKRFQGRHPDLNWGINAGQQYGQLHLSVETPYGMHPVTVLPTLDMADSVFTALEQLFKSLPAQFR